MWNDSPTGPFQVGERILQRFDVLGFLGRGGHAFVYHCHNEFLNEHVAIKVIPNLPHRGQQPFNRARGEAQVLFRLNHPNLVRVTDGGDIDGMAYIIMEKLDGMSLREYLTRMGPLTVLEALTIALPIARALEAAHELQVIHRDLKPENVFLLAGNHVKVLDFGIAKFLEGGYQTTQRDLIQGTAPYMSPEQAQGHGVTFASDIFQLGTILYEMIAGVCPCMVGVEEPTLQVIVALQISRLPPRLRSLVPNVPEYVDRIVWRSLAKYAQQRYSTMREFTAVISAALARLVAELPPREHIIRALQVSNSDGRSDSRSTPIAPITSQAQTSETGARRGTAALRPASVLPPGPKLNIASTFYEDLPLARDLNAGDLSGATLTDPMVPSAKTELPVVKRMLLGAILIGAAIGLPAGVAFKIFRRSPAAAAVSVLSASALPVGPTAAPPMLAPVDVSSGMRVVTPVLGAPASASSFSAPSPVLHPSTHESAPSSVGAAPSTLTPASASSSSHAVASASFNPADSRPSELRGAASRSSTVAPSARIARASARPDPAKASVTAASAPPSESPMLHSGLDDVTFGGHPDPAPTSVAKSAPSAARSAKKPPKLIF